MRVRLHDTGFNSNSTSCGNSDYGQVEDYTVVIYDDYVYYDGAWTPTDPSGVSTATDNVLVVEGSPTLTGITATNNLSILPSQNLNIEGVLNVSGNIENDGNLVFKSNSTATAQLGTFTGTISGTGNITVERFIPAGDNSKRAFRLLASAVTTGNSINANWQEGVHNIGTSYPANNLNPNPGYGTHITGSTMGANGFDATRSGNSSLFTFDKTGQTWNAIGNTNASILVAGKGYLLMVRGNRSINLTTNTPTPTNTTLRAKGSVLTGLVDYSGVLAQGDGEFSLIGNPYQSIVDFGALSFTGNINSNFIFVWNPNLSTAGAYVTIDVSTNPSQAMIQPGQSFFVENSATVSTPPSLQFTENAKNTSGMVNSVFSVSQIALANLELYNPNDIKVDVVKFRFEPGAYNGIDDFDAGKLTNITENLAAVNGTSYLSVERRDLPQDNDIVPLSISQYQETQYEFRLDTSDWVYNIEVYMVDHYLDTTTLIDSSNPYSFSIDSNIPESIASERFSLSFDNTTLGVDDNTFGKGFSLYPNPTNDGRFTIKAQDLSGQVANIKIHNMLGQALFNSKTTVGSNGEVNVNASTLSAGIYMVELNQNEQKFISKLIIE
jgi:hypothetical protein